MVEYIGNRAGGCALESCRAAIGARVVGTFYHTIGMQDHGAGMAHEVAVTLADDLHVVPGREQAVDQMSVETLLQAQIGHGRTPIAAEEEARAVERLGERLAIKHMAGEQQALSLRLAVPPHGAIGY